MRIELICYTAELPSETFKIDTKKMKTTKNKYISVVANTAYYIYNFRLNMIKELQSQGYTVVVITPYDEYVPSLKKYGVIHHSISMSQYGMNPLQDLSTTFQIYNALKKYKPLISLHFIIKPNTFGNIAARFSNIPVINNIAGAGKAFSSPNKVFTTLIKFLFRFGLSSSKKVFFQNLDDMQVFIENKLVKKDISERIPGSGVDLQRFTQFSKKSSTNTTFLFVGRLLKQKGIGEFLYAADEIKEQFSNVKFVIVGVHEEDNNDYIEKKTLELLVDNKRIIYLGSVSPDTMPSVVNDADCVVLPSYYREGVPRSLLEAAAMSKPIITTENIGCKEVVDEGINGFKCKVKNIDCLVDSMIKVIQMSNKERESMGFNGRKKMEKEFDEKIVIDRYLDTIAKLINAN